jgi:flagellin-like protein
MGDKLAGRTRKVLVSLGQGLEVSELVRTSRAEYSIVAASLIVAITVAATV